MWDANALLFSITGYSRTPTLHWDPKIPGGTSSEGLQEHFPTLKGLNFAQVSESLAWGTLLVCTEVPLSPEQLTTAMPFPEQCWRGMAVASQQVKRRHYAYMRKLPRSKCQG